MKIGKILAMALTLAYIEAGPAYAGIALSTPSMSPITIDRFPFHYENKFRVYNTGGADSVFTIDVIAQYPDVADWVTFDKKIFVLKPNESTQVTFAIDAKEGYTGAYKVILRPTVLPEGVTDLAGIQGTQRAYIKTGIDFGFSIIVPDKVGSTALGERPPPRAIGEAQKTGKEDINTIAIGETLKAENGVIKTDLSKPLVLDIPSEAAYGKPVTLSASFIGGGEPDAMGLLISSPTGKTYHLPRTASFIFNEEGRWAVLVVIADNVLVGKAVNVSHPAEASGTEPMIFGKFIDAIPKQMDASLIPILAVIFAAVAVVFHRLKVVNGGKR